MRRKTFLVLVAATAAGLPALVNCLSDPREDDEVAVIEACDENALSTDPASPQSSLRAYLDATRTLLTRATEVETNFRDACNSIDEALGIAGGNTIQAACDPITVRADAVVAKAAVPLGPGAPEWVEFRFPDTCKSPPDALTKCVSSCTAQPCDVGKCEPRALFGKCAGECNGPCSTTGDGVACTTTCSGSAPIPTAIDCIGECVGTCQAAAWMGTCSGRCTGAFTGVCGGECRGKCDGVDIVFPEAGAPEGGAPEGGADGGDAGPPGPQTGNCKGICVGTCSAGASGTCAGSPCLETRPVGPPAPGVFDGFCRGLCIGKCNSASRTGAVGTCNGECFGNSTQCAGECRGACTGEVTEKVCRGTLNCGQNVECEHACQARSLLDSVCTAPPESELYATGDAVFAKAIKERGGALGKAVSELAMLRDAASRITNRAYGDFIQIGLKGSLVRACVAKGNDEVSQATKKIDTAIVANPSLRRPRKK